MPKVSNSANSAAALRAMRASRPDSNAPAIDPSTNRSDRMIAGVMGGFAGYLRIEPSLTRIGYVVMTVLTGFVPGVFLYLVMMLIIPPEPDSER